MQLILMSLVLLGAALGAQSAVFAVDPTHDSVNAAAGARLVGVAGGGQQQILIDRSRLQGLIGKRIEGLVFRRDPHHPEPMGGGQLDLQLRLGTSPALPRELRESFAANLQVASTQLVYSGRLSVPQAPAWNSSRGFWDADQVLRIDFTSPFTYAGGNLLIDLQARPVAGAAPQGWYLDHAMGGPGGRVTVLGKACGSWAPQQTLFVEELGLQIGSSFRATALGQPGARPLMLFGSQALPAPVDLGVLGAAGCSVQIQELLIAAMGYQVHAQHQPLAALNFRFQVPAQVNLLGASFCMQFAEDETGLPRSQWSNPAGLTLGSGLELQLASAAPSLGMATVTSEPVDAQQPLPLTGTARPELAPVMRLLYR